MGRPAGLKRGVAAPQSRLYVAVRRRQLAALRQAALRRRESARLRRRLRRARDEYVAALIDLGLAAPPGDNLRPARRCISALSGLGRETGLPAQAELAARWALSSALALALAAPVPGLMADSAAAAAAAAAAAGGGGAGAEADAALAAAAAILARAAAAAAALPHWLEWLPSVDLSLAGLPGLTETLPFDPTQLL